MSFIHTICILYLLHSIDGAERWRVVLNKNGKALPFMQLLVFGGMQPGPWGTGCGVIAEAQVLLCFQQPGLEESTDTLPTECSCGRAAQMGHQGPFLKMAKNRPHSDQRK